LLISKNITSKLITTLFVFISLNVASQIDSADIKIDSALIKYDSIPPALDTGKPIPDSLIDGTPKLSILREKEATEIIDSTLIYFFEGTMENLKKDIQLDVDTNILNAHKFDPLKIDNGMYSTLSNIGLAHKSLVFKADKSTGYSLRINSFDKYVYRRDGVKYYKLYIPQSNISYVMGSKKEQNLHVDLNREIIKNLTIGFNYSLNNSPGPYKSSKSNNTRVYFTGQYYTQNKRYGIVANYRNSRIRVEENGGLVNDSVFENNVESDRRLFEMNLNKASQKLINSGFYVEQYFNLLKPSTSNDSSKRKIDAGHLSYSIGYERNQLIYTDDQPLSDFYAPYYPPIDSTLTFDSIYQSSLSNKLMWSSLGYNEDKLSKVFYMYFGAQHKLISQTMAYDSVAIAYNEVKPFAGISLNLFKSMHFKAYGELILSDYSGGDYKLKAEIDQYLGNEKNNVGRIDGSIELLSRKPYWWYENFNSNRFRWTNEFKKENSMIISGRYSWKNLSGGLVFNTFSNYTYLDDSVKPQQVTNTETHLQIFVSGNLNMKKFGMDTRLVYQKVSIPAIIRVPDFSGLLNIYFRSTIFKDAATVQTGFQINYYTAFYADAYMPELRAFYLQNDKKIGNYVFADFYVSLNVKRAILFFKAAHLNSYLGDYRYYNTPHYPGRDARFYFGVSWRFYN
jgi:hypothetical protein